MCSDVLVCSGSDRKSYDTFVTVVQHRELLQNNPGSEENKKKERERIFWGDVCSRGVIVGRSTVRPGGVESRSKRQ